MDENAKARDLEEQATITRQPWGPAMGPGARTSLAPLGESCEPAYGELDLLRGKAAGHRWDGWRRLTGGEDYFAACSCGWRSTETGCVSPMLRQVKEHLDAVSAIRGGRPSTRAAPAPARDERARDASQREMGPDERARELYASVESQHAACPAPWSSQVICCLPARTRPIGSWPCSSTRRRESHRNGQRPAHLCGANRLCNARWNA
jgi:hypothetical protein